MTKKAGAVQTTLIPDPPPTVGQEAAIEYIEKLEELKDLQEEVKDAKDNLIRLAIKTKCDVIKVRRRDGELVIFDFTNDVKVKKSVMTDRKVEKAEAARLAGRHTGGN